MDDARRHMKDSVDEIERLKRRAELVLGEESMCTRMLIKHLDDYANNLQFGIDNMK